MFRFTLLALSTVFVAAEPIRGALGSFLNLKGQVKAGSEFEAARQEELDKVHQDPLMVADPCKNIKCPNLVCPAGFVVEPTPSHCCAYCVPTNPALIKTPRTTRTRPQQLTQPTRPQSTA